MFSRPLILVATDFSDSSDHALRAAEKLRRASNGKVQVIHVTPYLEQWDWLTNDVVINYTPDDYKKDLMASLHHKIAIQLNKCQLEASSEILLGPTAPTILKYLSSMKPDLVVLGRKKTRGPFHFSGVAGKVMTGAGVAVLIVHDDFEIDRLAGLVDPYHADKKLFSVTEELAYLCSGQVEFVSVCQDKRILVEHSLSDSPQLVKMSEEKKKAMKEQMGNTLKENADPHSSALFRTEISSENSVDELVRILKEDEIQLAVMAKHHKGKLEKFLLGSVTKGVLDHWQGNLLVLPS